LSQPRSVVLDLIFVSVDKILKCGHSVESYWAVHSNGAVYCAVQGVLTLESSDEILKFNHSDGTTEQYFPVALFNILYKVVVTLKSMNDIP